MSLPRVPRVSCVEPRGRMRGQCLSLTLRPFTPPTLKRSYDIYGSWNDVAGSNTDMPYIVDTVNYVVGEGVPREKLVLGLATYGRSSALDSPTCVAAGCGISGTGLVGCHGEPGNLPWFQIEEEYMETGNYDSLVRDARSGSVHMVTGGGAHFTSFDDEATFNVKYQYAYKQCMRGVM
ncbi:hypothetical protein ACHAWF_000548, partial [Thalassiosira exigua]